MDTMNGVFEFTSYTSEYKDVWDEFVSRSRNATFLLRRAYMGYHADRFEDASLMAFRKGKLAAILPACHLPGDVISTHAGLTYGGWCLPASHIDGVSVLTLFNEWIEYCKLHGYKELRYKPIPYIYHLKPSQEDLYALWRCGFRQEYVQLSSAIEMQSAWKFDMSKRQQVRKVLKENVLIGRSGDFAGFWTILTQCLNERHEATPVHSLEEITSLAATFPDNIKLYTISDADGLQAGVCIYETDTVAHSQYAATTAKARAKYYLTALYHHILTEEFAHKRYFDFGTSNEQNGHCLNDGLLNQKFAMGATGVTYEQFKLTL